MSCQLFQGGYYRSISNAAIMAFAAIGLFAAAGCMHVLKRLGKQPYQHLRKLWVHCSFAYVWIALMWMAHQWDRGRIRIGSNCIQNAVTACKGVEWLAKGVVQILPLLPQAEDIKLVHCKDDAINSDYQLRCLFAPYGNQCQFIKSHMREDNDPLGHHLGNEDLLPAVEFFSGNYSDVARFEWLHSIFFIIWDSGDQFLPRSQ